MDNEHWAEYPLRWAQLTLVENDPGTFDPDFWLDYFRRVNAQGACLSAGGYICYYPTEIPLHYRSAWMGDTDPFGELVAGCRAMDMAVLARTDPHAVHRDAFEAHPEWIAVDAEGNYRKHWSMPDAWVTCALGPYNFEFMTEVHREIVRRYDVHGIFSNRWSGHGICYCDACQRTFREATGLALPRTQELSDPSWRAYVTWREARLFELSDLWDAAIRDVRPYARYIPNSGGGALSSLDMKALSDRVPLLFADRQARQGIETPWASGKNAKEYRAAFGAEAGRRDLQRGAGGALPVEGLGPGCAGAAGLGGRQHRQRDAPVVHQVFRANLGRPLAARRRGDLHLAREARSLLARPGPDGHRGPGLFAADRVAVWRPGRPREGRGPDPGRLRGAGRGAYPLRDGPRPADGRRPPGTLQDPHPAQCRRALRRAVRAAPRFRPGRGQPGGDLRDVAATTKKGAGARPSGWPTSSASTRRPARSRDRSRMVISG